MKDYYVHLYDARLFGLGEVGGKAFNLSVLKSKGFRVPHGWVITTKMFSKVLAAKDPKKEFLGLWAKLAKSMVLNPKKKYAVRSSANVEDQLAHSFAGQFESFLNVKPAEVAKRVWDVLESVSRPQVKAYLKALGQGQEIKMAVIVQEMVDVERAGVVFGKDVQTGNDDLIVVDVAKGLGEKVVSGTGKTQRLYYSRSHGLVLDNEKSGGIMTKYEVLPVVEMTISIERLMGKTQDVEWAMDKIGDLWIIQSRDL